MPRLLWGKGAEISFHATQYIGSSCTLTSIIPLISPITLSGTARGLAGTVPAPPCISTYRPCTLNKTGGVQLRGSARRSSAKRPNYAEAGLSDDPEQDDDGSQEANKQSDGLPDAKAAQQTAPG